MCYNALISKAILIKIYVCALDEVCGYSRDQLFAKKVQKMQRRFRQLFAEERKEFRLRVRNHLIRPPEKRRSAFWVQDASKLVCWWSWRKRESWTIPTRPQTSLGTPEAQFPHLCALQVAAIVVHPHLHRWSRLLARQQEGREVEGRLGGSSVRWSNGMNNCMDERAKNGDDCCPFFSWKSLLKTFVRNTTPAMVEKLWAA
jgi:hypothetical protein